MSNASIYGPPAHTPDTFTLVIERNPTDGGWFASIGSTSKTSKGRLWHVKDVLATDGTDPNQHHTLGLGLQALISDMVRDLPSTEARALFVAGGGLYEQLHLEY